MLADMFLRNYISIHAPAKGATYRVLRCCYQFFYFNPRSREGSDMRGHGWVMEVYNFNPRSREGSDDAPGIGISFDGHFNPRSREGSDKRLPPCDGRPAHFNPRSREGSDSACQLHYFCAIQFQSTLPRRERQHLLTSFRLQYGYFYFISPIKYSSCFKKIN